MTKKSWVGDRGAGLDYDDSGQDGGPPPIDPGGNIKSNQVEPRLACR